MAKTQWLLLFVIFLSSCMSFVLFIVAAATPDWIVAKASSDDTKRESEINYGLFSGSLFRYVLSSGQKYDLTVICDYHHDACMYSCQTSAESREDELRRALNGETFTSCSISNRMYNLEDLAPLQNNASIFRDNDIGCPNCIKPGFWLTTLISLCLGIIFAAIAAAMAFLNIILNPVEPILSIFGLYIWNGVTVALAVLTMIVWGSLYEGWLNENIAITDTLQIESLYKSQASLGYSFWIIFVSVLLNTGNVGFLRLRKYLIDKEPPPPTITVDKSDSTIMLY